MSETNGGSTGPVPTELDELDAARADWQQKSAVANDLWEAYQKGRRSRSSWQEAEADAILAGRRYAAALREEEARKG